MSNMQQLAKYARLLSLRKSVLERERSGALREAQAMRRQIDALRAANVALRLEIDALYSLACDQGKQGKTPGPVPLEMRLGIAAALQDRLKESEEEIEEIEAGRADAETRANSVGAKLSILRTKVTTIDEKLRVLKQKALLLAELRLEDELPALRRQC